VRRLTALADDLQRQVAELTEEVEALRCRERELEQPFARAARIAGSTPSATGARPPSPPLPRMSRQQRRGHRSETSVEWLGIPELAQMLGVSEDFIRSQVQQRKIPYYKVGKLIRFDPREITQWLSGLRVEPLF